MIDLTELVLISLSLGFFWLFIDRGGATRSREPDPYTPAGIDAYVEELTRRCRK